MTTCMGNCCSPGCRLWCLWWCLFVLSFFPRGVLDEILYLIESVSEGFPSYFWYSSEKSNGCNEERKGRWVTLITVVVGWSEGNCMVCMNWPNRLLCPTNLDSRRARPTVLAVGANGGYLDFSLAYHISFTMAQMAHFSFPSDWDFF